MARHGWVGLWGSSSCALLVGVLLWGCGAADGAAAPGSTDVPGHADDASNGSNGPATEGELGGDSLSGGGTSAACGDSFRACGGTLFGDWQVEGTCEPVAQDDADARRWAQGVLALDEAACGDSLQTWTSLWSGTLGFRDGEANDDRSRADTLELRLTSECLVASRSELSGVTDLAAACASLSSGAAMCSASDGACHCWLEREEHPDSSGIYAVLDTSVAIGRGASISRVDYCVEGDVLHWQEPGSAQHLTLRRLPAP